MKRTAFTFLSAVMVLALSFTSCSKYEEGPAFSLRSKKERVANTWKVAEMTEDGEKVDPEEYEGMSMTFTKDGDLTQEFEWQGTTISTSGTWEFNDDKTKIITKINNIGSSSANETENEILKLKEKELWIQEEDDDGEITEIHLEPK